MHFTDEFRKKELPLHILVNNAGIAMVPFKLTEDGIEIVFATNYVGHFLLTRRLLDILVKSKPCRIVNVSSHAHQQCPNEGIPLDTFQDEKGYSGMKAYAYSKLANILFTKELTKRLKDEQVCSTSLHPGEVATEIWREWWSGLQFVLSKLLMSEDSGAVTTLYCATSPEVVEKKYHGSYFVSWTAVFFYVSFK
jgi:NAD(P)-dependent dehydrogenase (short-subunit alcohol dehydrogenase family)